MSYIKLHSHYTNDFPDGVHVGAIGMSTKLGNGTAVELPIPFIPISHNLGIAPGMVPDGQTALRIDFTRWAPVRYGRDLVTQFPFHFTTQEMAVKVARAFDTDPATHWRSGFDEIDAWLRTWGPANGLTFA